MQWLKQGGMSFFSRTEEVGTGVAAAACNAGRVQGSAWWRAGVQKLVVVISNIESGEVLERWQFDIEFIRCKR